jgi:NOL1/NOP2/sun family putative RNA methylase
MPAGKTSSIGEVRRRLPREFIARLSAELPPNLADRILHGMGADRPTTLRVNSLSWDARSLMRFFKENAVKHRRVSWYPDAFLLTDARERDVEAWEPYRQGRIYMQSLSSLIPALALEPRPGERVLDLAAAPGSKTTQMAALMAGRGLILANEVNPVRAERLAYNVRLQGCAAVEVRVGRGEKIGAEMPCRFDRVLLDAPCSGEGRFIAGRPATSRFWSPRIVAESARLQRRLMASAVAALKPGGTLLYSTCTLNREENERIISWALESFPLETERIPVSIPGALAGLADGLDPAVARALRILPDREFEGFFICRMKKRVDTAGGR